MSEWNAGDKAIFDGKSPDGITSGRFCVKIIDPHVNAADYGKTEGKGRNAREYDKQGHRHIRRALVENLRSGKQFQANDFQLKAWI